MIVGIVLCSWGLGFFKNITTINIEYELCISLYFNVNCYNARCSNSRLLLKYYSVIEDYSVLIQSALASSNNLLFHCFDLK